MDGYTFCILAIGATYPSWATSNTIFTTMFFFFFPTSDPDGAIASSVKVSPTYDVRQLKKRQEKFRKNSSNS